MKIYWKQCLGHMAEPSPISLSFDLDHGENTGTLKIYRFNSLHWLVLNMTVFSQPDYLCLFLSKRCPQVVLWGYSVFTSGEQRASTLLSRVRLRQRIILKMTMIMMGFPLKK